MLAEAGRVLGLAKGALIRAFKGAESLDFDMGTAVTDQRDLEKD